jgi:hypothetical protein
VKVRNDKRGAEIRLLRPAPAALLAFPAIDEAALDPDPTARDDGSFDILEQGTS